MEINLGYSEIKVMNILWKEGDSTARHIADVMQCQYGWNINTTYTLLKRCIRKGAVQRIEPNFVCHALLSCDQIQKQEIFALIRKVFDGSINKLFASLLSDQQLTNEQISNLKSMVSELGDREE